MKKLLLATSFFVVSSATVMAADMPMQTKAPIVTAPVFSWTGCYIGVHAGGGMMTSSNAEGLNGKGGVAGGQAGCNYQDGNWVLGVEGEGYWSGIRQTNNGSAIPNIINGNFVNQFGTTLKNKDDWTVAARAGITFDRTLIYGKGGWAWGQFNQLQTQFCCALVGGNNTSRASSATLDGFLVGVGIEHALTRNWTVKAEYNFIGFGAKEVAFTQCQNGVCVPGGTQTMSATKQIFKLGANYLFDFGGGPVVARY